MTDDTWIARSARFLATDVEGEVVILSLDDDSFYRLNPVGSRIWGLLETPRTLAALCETVLDGFEVDRETCRADVVAFLDAMGGRGLLSTGEAASEVAR